MKVKSSSTFPPGLKSFNKHIRRVNFQLYEWVRFERNINGNGRKQDEEDGKIIPVWYEGRWLLFDVHVDDHFEENCIFLFILGSQLPEFRKETSKKKRKREETNDEVSYLADENDLEILFTLVIKTKVISSKMTAMLVNWNHRYLYRKKHNFYFLYILFINVWLLSLLIKFIIVNIIRKLFTDMLTHLHLIFVCFSCEADEIKNQRIEF